MGILNPDFGLSNNSLEIYLKARFLIGYLLELFFMKNSEFD